MWNKYLIILMTGLISHGAWASYFAIGENNVARGLQPVTGQSITSLQPYQGRFRILSSKTYFYDEQAKFSPMDLAVSSGLFTHAKIASTIRVQQYNRYLKWSIPYLYVPAVDAKKMVSNVHVVPANPKIAQAIQHIQRGDLVYLKGDLVQIKDRNLVWTSSTRRDDVGDGACEVFRINSIQWLERTKI